MAKPKTPAQLTAEVLKRHAATPDARLKSVMRKLVKHLHAFVLDTKLTPAEWFAAIDFLTRTGQISDDKRQEFILLSDTLGVSMLVDMLDGSRPHPATESTVLGPFHVKGAPLLPYGGNIAKADPGVPAIVQGRVLDAKGRPIAGAELDVWQTASNGLYDVQDPNQPAFNLRGRFVTGPDGAYRVRTVRPLAYSIPDDGPVGQMLKATKRHPMRPAHIHFIVGAKGYRPVTTHVFDKTDKYLKSDAVFGVKDSLVQSFAKVTSRKAAAAHGLPAPFYLLDFDFRLHRQR